jgi:hypothetical protein
VALGLVLKRLLLAFWTMYFSMIALTNGVDVLDEFGVARWKFLNSGNFDYLRSVVKVYEVGPGPTKAMLLAAFAIEIVGAIAFWRALLRFGRRPGGRTAALQAICWGTAVWIAFVFMTEFFVAYQSESVFRELLALMIGTALAVTLVPDDAGAGD